MYADDVAGTIEMRVRDSASNVTTISPHNRAYLPYEKTHDLAWTYHSERPDLGRGITCDMYELARAVETLAERFNLPRTRFIFEGAVELDEDAEVRHRIEATERRIQAALRPPADVVG
jgi:hypothetical protein